VDAVDGLRLQPIQDMGEALKHGLYREKVVVGGTGLNFSTGRKSTYLSGIGKLSLQIQPLVQNGLPGLTVHHAGDRGVELPLEEHHRLQGTLPEHTVRDQSGQKVIAQRQAVQHILKTPYGLGHHLAFQLL
jgi:hypothetical protein